MKKLMLLASRVGLSLLSLVVAWLILANLFWLWNHRLSSSPLSTPEEIRQYHDRGAIPMASTPITRPARPL